jgi:hypothetical protein
VIEKTYGPEPETALIIKALTADATTPPDFSSSHGVDDGVNVPGRRRPINRHPPAGLFVKANAHWARLSPLRELGELHRAFA